MQFSEPLAHLAHIPENHGSRFTFTSHDRAVPVSLVLRTVQRALDIAKEATFAEPFEERSVGKETRRDKVDSGFSDGPND
jgi:hypothetical protein